VRPSEILAEKREEVLAIIARYPVANPRLFGSVARGEDGEASDVDILVDTTGRTSLFDIVGLELELVKLLGLPVDVFTPNSLKSGIREQALHDQKPL
jgi:uncharacterized protein